MGNIFAPVEFTQENRVSKVFTYAYDSNKIILYEFIG
jgi:hypothetical protein